MTIEKLKRANDLAYRIKKLQRSCDTLKHITDNELKSEVIDIGYNNGGTGYMSFSQDPDIIESIPSIILKATLVRIRELEDQFKSL